MAIWSEFVKEFRSKIFWLRISLGLVFLTCYCFQGDDARPVLVSHDSPIACHVIFERTYHRYVTKNCSCRCWIWCKTTVNCTNWSLQTEIQLLQPQLSKHKPILKFLTTTCSSCCKDKDFNSSILYNSIVQQKFACDRNPYYANSSYCDNHIVNNSCCSVFCSSEEIVGPCIYFYLEESTDSTAIHSKYKDNLGASNSSSNNANVFSRRRKRKSDFELPYHIEVLNNKNEFTVQEPFSIKVQLTDKWGSVVPDSGRNVELRIISTENGTKRNHPRQTFRTFLMQGKADFSNISFKQTGNSYRLLVASLDVPAVAAWSSEQLTVNYRPLTVRASGRTLPISPRENDTMSPAAGVILYDVMNNKPASKSYLSQYVWECTISLLYDDVYPGVLLGTTSKLVQDGSNEIIFSDVVITEWGYSYILKIQITAKETSYWNLTCLLGPFNVDILDTFEQPLVESDEYRNVKIVFDGDYDIVKKDEAKFEIFFLNHFGRKYSDVRWKNVTVSKGSIIVDAIITGLTGNLDMTSQSLETDIQNGKADVTYDQYLLKANQVFLPSRKLLEEKTDGESSDEGAGGLSVAWIVAIVVNVVLIVFFILAIIYCYCRRKKHRTESRSSSLQNFNGGPNSVIYANKGENNGLKDKAAIFTVEDSHAKLGNHRSLSGKIHGDNERCNCLSPTCYCSVGDGRKTETTLHHSEEENEDDPQGYPTPSPEPKFPTPQPSPEPSEDFWRPDSYPPQEEEEPEDEEMFLPGAVSDPSPELPQEERFYVYLLTAVDGSRELVGQIYLKIDDFLNDTRRAIDNDRDLSEVIVRREYRFLDENLDAIPIYQESSLDLERIFPSQAINIQYIPQKAPTPKPDKPKRPKLPAYVGPLGICNAPDCTRAAKIKCLDCRNVAYCTKRCMQEDAKDHRRSCYKPAWRV